MDIGRMKERITFQRQIVSDNEAGDAVTVWENYCTVWAAATNLFGKELFAAMQVQAEHTIKFTIRYIKNVDESMRIMFKGKAYDITMLDNIKYDNRFIEISATAVM